MEKKSTKIILALFVFCNIGLKVNAMGELTKEEMDALLPQEKDVITLIKEVVYNLQATSRKARTMTKGEYDTFYEQQIEKMRGFLEPKQCINIKKARKYKNFLGRARCLRDARELHLNLHTWKTIYKVTNKKPWIIEKAGKSDHCWSWQTYFDNERGIIKPFEKWDKPKGK